MLSSLLKSTLTHHSIGKIVCGLVDWDWSIIKKHYICHQTDTESHHENLEGVVEDSGLALLYWGLASLGRLSGRLTVKRIKHFIHFVRMSVHQLKVCRMWVLQQDKVFTLAFNNTRMSWILTLYMSKLLTQIISFYHKFMEKTMEFHKVHTLFLLYCYIALKSFSWLHCLSINYLLCCLSKIRK